MTLPDGDLSQKNIKANFKLLQNLNFQITSTSFEIHSEKSQNV